MDSLVKLDATEARRILISDMLGWETHGFTLVIWHSRFPQFQLFMFFFHGHLFVTEGSNMLASKIPC